MIPDRFIMRNGAKVKSLEDWEVRRKEISEDAIGLELDGMPPKPEVFKLERLNHGTRSIVHEIGHALCLGHPDGSYYYTNEASVMKRSNTSYTMPQQHDKNDIINKYG